MASEACRSAAGLREKIETAKREGELGRRQLVDHVARMSIEEIAALSPAALALLGPDGLAAVAKERGDLRPLAPARVREAPSKPTAPRIRRPLRSALLAASASIAVGFVAEAIVPRAIEWQDTGERSRSTVDWPLCGRLDRRVDGCIYIVTGRRLTLARAASLLELPLQQLVTVNPGLPIEAALLRGDQLIVWRGKMRLSGV